MFVVVARYHDVDVYFLLVFSFSFIFIFFFIGYTDDEYERIPSNYIRSCRDKKNVKIEKKNRQQNIIKKLHLMREEISHRKYVINKTMIETKN